MDLLASLVDKSLVTLDESEDTARYRMLETIRDYAREKLEEAGELSSMSARHCEHYFRIVEASPRRNCRTRAGRVDTAHRV